MRVSLKTALVFLVFVSPALAVAGNVQGVEKNKAKTVSQKNRNKPGLVKAGELSSAQKRTSQQNVQKSAQKSTQKGAPRKTARQVSEVIWEDPHKLAVQSGSALVFDQGSNDALYQKNAHAVAPIASITKLMTAMVVLDSSPNLQAPITISDDDVDYLRGSRSRLHVGAVMTRETALLLALMSSENRAANALARHYPGGLPAFVAAMNHKAEAIGMKASRFEDPTGLSSTNVSTAYDLARLVAVAYRYPLIREWSTMPEAVVDINGREMAYHNTNPLVKNPAWDVGLSKTGYIHEAGKCLVMQARVADKPVVIVLLDSVGKLTRVGDANRIKRWMENLQAGRKLPTHAVASPEDSRHSG